MAMNWMLPVRAVQAVLSIVILGLMAYGTSDSSYSALQPQLIQPYSLIVVVSSLATILSTGDQLPHLRTSMESVGARAFTSHLARQTHPFDESRHNEMGLAGRRGHDYVVLAQRLCLAGCVSER
jgi:hypothetical protein